MQTAVEWLIEQVESPNWLNLYAWHKKEVFDHAKQMEKEQAELRYKDDTPMRKYNSPKLKTIEMENKQTAVEWLFQQLWDEPKDKFTWYALREKAIKMEKEKLENARPQIISNCVIKEISDEEIDNEAERYEKVDGINSFKEAIKWYREQLKKK